MNPPILATDSQAAPPRVQGSLSVGVFFDFVCPWCLIGERHLRAALTRFSELCPDIRPTVKWRSHQLLPDTPLGGVPYQRFYIDRLGSAAAVAARRAQVQRLGEAAGIEFAFERIDVLPNTAAAHDLVAYAGESGTIAQQAQLIDRLFTAFFVEGRDIGDATVLRQLALDCGLPVEGLLDPMEDSRRRGSRTMRQPLQADDAVTGVPFFMFNRSHAVSGAASSDVLLQAMLQSRAER